MLKGTQLLFLLLFILPAAFSTGLEDIRFKHITVEEGLNNSIVYHIFQDKEGIMWFGLHDGIDKYDAYDFKHYDLNDKLPVGKGGHRPVNSVFQLSPEKFWIGSGANLYEYNLEKDEFDLRIEGFPGSQIVNQISAIYITQDDLCILGTNVGVFLYDIKTGELKQIPEFNLTVLSLHYQDGVLWIGTLSGIKFLNTSTFEFIEPYPDLQDELIDIHALTFYYDNSKNLTLIGTRRKGLFSFDGGNPKLKLIKSGRKNFRNIKVIRKYGSNYLIGTDGSGMIILDKEYSFLKHYKHNVDDVYSLSNNGVYDIHIDEQKRIWISTYGGGINIYDPNKKPFQVFQHIPNRKNSLANNVSRSIHEVGDDIWFGTASGISILKANGKWEQILQNSESGESNIILSLCKDSYGRIWAGSFSQGIFILNKKGEVIRNLRSNSQDDPNILTDYIYVIYEDSEKNIWIGGIRGDLMRYNQLDGSIQSFAGVQNVNSIVETKNSEILIGTLNGIFHIEKNANKSDYSISITEDSLLTNLDIRVFSIFESAKDEFWIGTEGSGLINYNRKTNSLKIYTIADGLSSNIVYGILADSKSNLWLSTSSGLSSFHIADSSFHNYSSADGLSGKDFNYGAYLKSSEGIFYFGGANGITFFDPLKISDNNVIPNVVLTKFSVYEKDVSNHDNSFTGININELDQIELKHNQGSFMIDFAALNFTSSEKNLYRWKFEGLNENKAQWNEASTERRAIFTYLPPGNYNFHVQASNNDRLWNRTGKQLNIFIKPPVWGTWFAKIFYAVLTGLFFIGLYRYLITLAKEKQANEKIRFFINIAHDIRTPLALIKGPLSKLLRSDQLSGSEKNEIELASRNSERLNNLVNQLLDFQKATLNKFPLQVAEYDIITLINDILNNFQPLMDKKFLNAKLDYDKDEFLIYMDKVLIEKILYNLISNAIKYSFDGGNINIIIESNISRVKLSVSDTGIGIPSKQQKEIFKRYFRADNAINSTETGSGVGLMLTKKLIEIHKGSIVVNSVENKGTNFIIEFPVQKEFYSESDFKVEEEVQEIETKDNTEGSHLFFENKYTILIAEDNTEMRKYLKDELQSAFNIILAPNGKDAIDKTIKMDVDLIISDIMMPVMDGWELCKNVKNSINTSHIPIILLTALDSDQYKIESMQYGADDYIDKPFDILYLKSRIHNILKSREALQERIIMMSDNQLLDEFKNKPDQQLMIDINKIVSDRISREDFSVEELCRIIGMSRPVLYRKLKSYTGQSPQEYLSSIRLNKAEILLRKGDMSIKEIAYETGFSDPKYFSKCFRKVYGVNPSNYLKSKSD